MKALVWHGVNDVRVDTVPEPKILAPTDAIVKVTTTAICGSDLHLLDGYMPTMEKGDILGHEFMGEIVEVGSAVKKVKVGDRVIVPFTISCGECFFCQKGFFSSCDNSNPNHKMAEAAMGHSPAGMFGYSHLTGGYAGGQAQYVRVPYADVGPFKVPSHLTDEQVLFLTDIYPTGYMAAENAQIEPGDTVAIWGCGPVGLFAIKSAWMFNPARVIAIDCVPERMALARADGRTETINFKDGKVKEILDEMTGGRGPDRCIDAVGCECDAHGAADAMMDRAKAAVGLATDRAHVIRECIMCCRKAGTVSMPGVYVGMVDKFPLSAFMNKGLTLKTGQTHVHKYLPKLLQTIESGEIDPSFLITHNLKLDDAPGAYQTFKKKEDGCIKVVLKPHA